MTLEKSEWAGKATAAHPPATHGTPEEARTAVQRLVELTGVLAPAADPA
jgi:hypothetical protein